MAVPVYSHSRLSTYETCPRQYRFQYLDRLEVPEVETAGQFLGSRVHEALEALYANVRFGRIPSPEGGLEFFRTAWQGDWAAGGGGARAGELARGGAHPAAGPHGGGLPPRGGAPARGLLPALRALRPRPHAGRGAADPLPPGPRRPGLVSGPFGPG